MTVDEALTYWRELKGLERVQMAIADQGSPAVEWRYVLGAIRDRVQLLTYGLSQVDPSVLAVVQDRYDRELSQTGGQLAYQGDHPLPVDDRREHVPDPVHLAVSHRIH